MTHTSRMIRMKVVAVSYRKKSESLLGFNFQSAAQGHRRAEEKNEKKEKKKRFREDTNWLKHEN